MKTYDEVIARMANTMFHSHMGGGSKRNGYDGYLLVSFIYEVPEDKVLADADAAFRGLNGGFD